MINWPVLPGTLFPAGPPGTPGLQGPIGITGSQGAIGPTGPAPWTAPTVWTTGQSYTTGPPASLVIAGGNLYVCILSHVSSGSFAVGSNWQLVLSLVSVNYQVPTTGFNITMAGTDTDLLLDPAGTLASGTVTLYASPYDGQLVRIRTAQQITSFTIAASGGKSVKGAPSAFTWPGNTFAYNGIFRGTNNTWYF